MPLTSTGYIAPTLIETKEAIESEQRSTISTELDLSTSSPDGQNNAIFARQIRKVHEALAALYAAMNPNGATGSQLDNLAALTGTTRRAATKSRVVAQVNFNATGTYAAGSITAAPGARPGDLFRNVASIVVTTAPSVVEGIVFEADETGPVFVLSGDLDLAAPISGVINLSNDLDATLGLLLETDSELRTRRNAEITAQGSTTVDAIAADLMRDVEGVLQAEVIENDTNSTVDGIPPHAFEAVVYGPATPSGDDDQAVAEQIFLSKPAGIQAYGTTTRTVTDAQGADHSIGLTRPTAVPAAVTLYANTRQDPTTAEEDAVRALIVERTAALRVGDNLDWSEVVGWAMSEVPGIIRVTGILIGPAAGPVEEFEILPITRRQIVTLQLADVIVDMSQGDP